MPAIPPSPHQHATVDLRECRACGAFQTLPAPQPDSVVRCMRCHAVFRHALRDPVTWPLALAITGLVLFCLAATTPLLGIEVAGRSQQMSLISGPVELDDQGTWELAVVVFATTLIMPFAKLAAVTTVLASLRLGRVPAFVARLFGRVERITPWAMVEVFLLGGFVAYTRLAAMAQVQIGIASYALGALMLVMVAIDATLDADAIWDAIGRFAPTDPGPLSNAPAAFPLACNVCALVSTAEEGTPCPRCGSHLRRRKQFAISRTWALTIAAAALYLPANMYPVMTVTYLGQGNPATIIGGMEELANAGMWPLAILVFIASITIPLLKLVALATLLITTERGARRRLRDRTRLYRIIEFIGRWSMIDVFIVAILVALLRLGVLASVEPGTGAVAFASVVVLTMLATISFDPRLMWDRAGRNPPIPVGGIERAASPAA